MQIDLRTNGLDELGAHTRAPAFFWRRVSLRTQMLYGFAASILIVLLASLFLLSELDTLRRSASANVDQAESVGLRHQLLNAVLDTETGLRGYQLTGDPAFLQPYSWGLRNFDRINDRLDAIEAGTPEDLRKLKVIQALFQRWRHDFAEPQIGLRLQTPVGIVNQLLLLSGLVGGADQNAPALDSQPSLRDYDAVVGRLQSASNAITPGQRAADLMSVLALAGTARGASPEAAVARVQLVAALRVLAGRMQADEDRISSSGAAIQGKRLVDAIRVAVEASLQQEIVEQNAAAAIAAADTSHAIWVALLVPVAALLIGLALILLLLIDAVRAIDSTSRAAMAVAGGDLQKRLKVRRHDEIGQLGTAFNSMADELAARHCRSDAIDRFQTLLLTSNSMEEIHIVVARMCGEMFPGASGAIYLTAASRNVADRVAEWNWPDAANGRALQPDDCRAMRSGQPYFVDHSTLEIPCRHTQQIGVQVVRSLCLPLAAQGETLGVLQLCRFIGNVQDASTARDRETAILISDQLSMSLANMQLREQLRNQSIRDPLTGLFNRRYLEETMERELARTARNGQPLAVVAIDVDHFKQFNDAHGHAAGDKVLVELAGVLRGGIRSTDIACRYGGEEFVLLMPESPPAITIERVEALRRRVRGLRVRAGDVQLEQVTISSGIAIAPGHGESAEALLRSADTALYAAKAAGRDRVIVYDSL